MSSVSGLSYCSSPAHWSHCLFRISRQTCWHCRRSRLGVFFSSKVNVSWATFPFLPWHVLQLGLRRRDPRLHNRFAEWPPVSILKERSQHLWKPGSMLSNMPLSVCQSLHWIPLGVISFIYLYGFSEMPRLYHTMCPLKGDRPLVCSVFLESHNPHYFWALSSPKRETPC